MFILVLKCLFLSCNYKIDNTHQTLIRFKSGNLFPGLSLVSVYSISGLNSKVSIRTNDAYNTSFYLYFSLIDSSSGYQYDSKAFLFSLVNKPGWAPVKLPQTGKYSSSRAYSIYCSSGYGPTFGNGHDFFITDNASSNSISHSDLGFTYSPPSGYSVGSNFARTFLAGTLYFTPDEVETFYETN